MPWVAKRSMSSALSSGLASFEDLMRRFVLGRSLRMVDQVLMVDWESFLRLLNEPRVKGREGSGSRGAGGFVGGW